MSRCYSSLWFTYTGLVGKALISLILLQLEKLCSISVREGSVLAAPGLPPAKTHFSEPGCSEKQSNSAHASLHMSSISSLSSLHLSLSLLALYLSFPSPWKWSVQPALCVDTGARLSVARPRSGRRPRRGGAGCCVTLSPLSQPWHHLNWKFATEEDELLSFTAIPPAASRWQRHTEQRSSIKVTTWSDVTAARAARTKAASAPFGIRTRLDRGGHN